MLRMKQFSTRSSRVMTRFSRGDHAGYTVATPRNVAACAVVPASRWQELHVSAFRTKGFDNGWFPVSSTISLPSATTFPSSPGGSPWERVGVAGASATADRPLHVNTAGPQHTDKPRRIGPRKCRVEIDFIIIFSLKRFAAELVKVTGRDFIRQWSVESASFLRQKLPPAFFSVRRIIFMVGL